MTKLLLQFTKQVHNYKLYAFRIFRYAQLIILGTLKYVIETTLPARAIWYNLQEITVR